MYKCRIVRKTQTHEHGERPLNAQARGTHNDIWSICRCDGGDTSKLLHAVHLVEETGQNTFMDRILSKIMSRGGGRLVVGRTIDIWPVRRRDDGDANRGDGVWCQW